MTKQTILNHDELNKRAEEVFELQYGDYIWDVTCVDDEVFVNMEEIDENGDIIIFDFKPDMSNRPEALDYLLGLRNDFSD